MSLTDQLAVGIEDRIRRGEFAPGDILPSERRLCQVCGVSRLTVRRALKLLTEKNLIRKHHGVGSVVSHSWEVPSPKVKLVAFLSFTSRPFTAPILDGIQPALEKEDVQLTLMNTDFDVRRERKSIQQLRSKVAGFLIVPCESRQNWDLYLDLVTQQVPVVFIDHFFPEIQISNVTSGNEEGGYLATSHLLSLGRRKIAFLSPPLNTAIRERLAGYRRALRKFKVKYQPELVRHSGIVPEPGLELLAYLRRDDLLNALDAIFVGNDVAASHILGGLQKSGIRVPEDISVVGFDDVEYAKHLYPALTTVRQPLLQMGSVAARMLCRMIRRGPSPYQAVRLKTKLIIRESTCAPRDFKHSTAHGRPAREGACQQPAPQPA